MKTLQVRFTQIKKKLGFTDGLTPAATPTKSGKVTKAAKLTKTRVNKYMTGKGKGKAVANEDSDEEEVGDEIVANTGEEDDGTAQMDGALVLKAGSDLNPTAEDAAVEAEVEEDDEKAFEKL